LLCSLSVVGTCRTVSGIIAVCRGLGSRHVPLGHPFVAPGRVGHAAGRMMGFADVGGDGQSGSIRRGDRAVPASDGGLGVMTCTASRPTVGIWGFMPLLRPLLRSLLRSLLRLVAGAGGGPGRGGHAGRRT